MVSVTDGLVLRAVGEGQDSVQPAVKSRLFYRIYDHLIRMLEKSQGLEVSSALQQTLKADLAIDRLDKGFLIHAQWSEGWSGRYTRIGHICPVKLVGWKHRRWTQALSDLGIPRGTGPENRFHAIDDQHPQARHSLWGSDFSTVYLLGKALQRAAGR